MTSQAVGWSIRAFFFVLVGVLTFLLQPPGATALKAQLVGYLVAGLGLLAWALVDVSPSGGAVSRPRAAGDPWRDRGGGGIRLHRGKQ